MATTQPNSGTATSMTVVAHAPPSGPGMSQSAPSGFPAPPPGMMPPGPMGVPPGAPPGFAPPLGQPGYMMPPPQGWFNAPPQFPGMNPYGGAAPYMQPPYVQYGMPPPGVGMSHPYTHPASGQSLQTTTSVMSSNAQQPELTSIRAWVGKYPADTDDALIKALLEECGNLKTWKRSRDPETEELKAFGFATFGDTLSTEKALRVLTGLPINRQHMSVVVDSKTKQQLRDRRATAIQSRTANAIEVVNVLEIGKKPEDSATSESNASGDTTENTHGTVPETDQNTTTSTEAPTTSSSEAKPSGLASSVTKDMLEAYNLARKTSAATDWNELWMLSEDEIKADEDLRAQLMLIVHEHTSTEPGERNGGKDAKSEPWWKQQLEKSVSVKFSDNDRENRSYREPMIDDTLRNQIEAFRSAGMSQANELKSKQDLKRKRELEELRRKAREEKIEKAKAEAEEKVEAKSSEPQEETAKTNHEISEPKKQDEKERRERRDSYDREELEWERRERRRRRRRSRSRSGSRERSHRSHRRRRSRSRSSSPSRSRRRHSHRDRHRSPSGSRSHHSRHSRHRESRRERDRSVDRDRDRRRDRSSRDRSKERDRTRRREDREEKIEHSKEIKEVPPVAVENETPAETVAITETVMQTNTTQTSSVTTASEMTVSSVSNTSTIVSSTTVAEPVSAPSITISKLSTSLNSQPVKISLSQRKSGSKVSAPVFGEDKNEEKYVPNFPEDMIVKTAKKAQVGLQDAWHLVDNTDVLSRLIEPWIDRRLVQYLGESEPTMKAFIMEQLRSHLPGGQSALHEELALVLDEDASIMTERLVQNLVGFAEQAAAKQELHLVTND